MSASTRFPHPSDPQGHSGALSDTPVQLDGMTVLFDEVAPLMPAPLERVDAGADASAGGT